METEINIEKIILAAFKVHTGTTNPGLQAEALRILDSCSQFLLNYKPGDINITQSEGEINVE
jgi:hypothetical protein